MKRPLFTLAALAALAVPSLAAAQGPVPLNQNAHVVDSLVAARVADVIRSTCPSITARMFVVYSELEDLKKYAIAQGYTEAEVKAFLKDKTEKDKLKAIAADYLTAAGAVEGDAESYCRVGRDEIARKTLAGSLLRSWK